MSTASTPPGQLDPSPMMEVGQPGMELAALHRLLATLFSADELRRWIRHGPDQDIALELPGTDATLGVLLDKAIAAFERRGRVDHEFFARLRNARPHRLAAIGSVERLWINDEARPARGSATGVPVNSRLQETSATRSATAGRPEVTTIQRFMMQFRADAGVFPAWPPAFELEIGDFGVVGEGTFRRRGNLGQLGVEVSAHLAANIPVVRHCSHVGWTTSAATAAQSSRHIELRFAAPGAYYFEARSVQKYQLDAWRDVERSLARLPRGCWDRRWHLVVEVWRAASTSIIVADEEDAALLLTCVGEPADSLAAAGIDLSVNARAGKIFDALQVHDSRPVFDTARVHGLFRPHLRDPAGSSDGVELALTRSTLEDFVARLLED